MCNDYLFIGFFIFTGIALLDLLYSLLVSLLYYAYFAGSTRGASSSANNSISTLFIDYIDYLGSSWSSPCCYEPSAASSPI